MKVVGLLVSATSAASWGEGWATKSSNKWPLSHFALLSTSELKIKTVKFELLFFHLRKEQDLQQLKNNHVTTTGALFGLPVYGLNFVKVNTCFVDFVL